MHWQSIITLVVLFSITVGVDVGGSCQCGKFRCQGVIRVAEIDDEAKDGRESGPSHAAIAALGGSRNTGGWLDGGRPEVAGDRRFRAGIWIYIAPWLYGIIMSENRPASMTAFILGVILITVWLFYSTHPVLIVLMILLGCAINIVNRIEDA